MLRVARALEREALAVPPDTVAACLQDVRYLTPRTRAVYSAIAVTGPRRVLFGRDLPAYIAPGVAGVALDDTDPLVDVWSVVLLSATAAVALAATDMHEPAALDTDRRFLLAVTRDRDAVSACLHTLTLRRVAAPGDLADAAERLRAEFADRLARGRRRRGPSAVRARCQRRPRRSLAGAGRTRRPAAAAQPARAVTPFVPACSGGASQPAGSP